MGISKACALLSALVECTWVNLINIMKTVDSIHSFGQGSPWRRVFVSSLLCNLHMLAMLSLSVFLHDGSFF